MIGRLKQAVGMGDEFDTGTENAIAEVELDREGALQLISNHRRRRVIHHLVTRDDGDGVELRDLSRLIAVDESDSKTKPSQITSTERKRVYIGLYQCHLPKLVDEGVAEFDRDNTVHATEGTYALNRVLEALAQVTGGEDR